LWGEEVSSGDSKITAVRNQVETAGSGTNRMADVGDSVRAGEAVKTGEQSLVELKGKGDTTVRIGDKSAMSFDATNRQVKLDQGTVLIHAPEKEGPVQITAGGVTVTVEEESGEKKERK
jgi:ferric-dicitrate binding protein FerR (iron transport regulator)